MEGAKVDGITHRALFTRAEPDRNTLAENKIRMDAFFRLQLFSVTQAKPVRYSRQHWQRLLHRIFLKKC